MNVEVKAKHLADLSSANPKVKYGRAKELVAIAKRSPEQLYPHLPFFVNMLKSENNILKWTAIDIAGLLVAADRRKRVEPLLKKFVAFLQEGRLITTSHATNALANIAIVRPSYRKRITQELLNIERYEYETSECHNIILGKVVQALDLYMKDQKKDSSVIEFVERLTSNPRPATRKKAQKFLRSVRSIQM